jgi:RNA polymerase sigma factor (sigma-70 family)
MSGDDALGSAMDRALRRPLLTASEERRLARRAALGDIAARDRLIERNTRLVVSLARGFRMRGVPYADLVQEGMIGLMHAVERFDPERGPRLATYAKWWIRGWMLRAISEAPAIRLPIGAHRDMAAILRSERELSGHGRPRPDSRTIAARTGVRTGRIDRLRLAPRIVRSLDDTVAGGETTFAELTADPSCADVASGLYSDLLRAVLRDGVAVLPSLTRRVIELRYAFDGGEPLTYEQIGEELGLSADRCRQIEALGLQRLRALAERASLAG